MHHELKIEIPYYEAVKSGDKTFEIRYNDRGYQKGDTITLKPIDERGCYDTFAKELKVQITYISNYQQKRGWCVFGIKPIEEQSNAK